MPTLSANRRLALLALLVVFFCSVYFLAAEDIRARTAKKELAQLTSASISAIHIQGGPLITSRTEINAIVTALQHSHWTTFGKSYATQRQRLFLIREHAPTYIVDLRSLDNGRELVQIVRFNSGNQSETLLLSGEIGPLLLKLKSASWLKQSRVTGLSALRKL